MSRWRTRPRRLPGDRGAAAVEFAIVVVLLIFILLSIIDFGRLFFAVQGVKSASREGARVAAVQSNAVVIANAVAGASDSAETLAGDGNGAVIEISTCTPNPSGSPATTFCSNETPLPSGAAGFTLLLTANTSNLGAVPSSVVPCATADAVEVRVTADFSWFTPTMPLLGTVVGPADVPTVSGTTTMRCERPSS